MNVINNFDQIFLQLVEDKVFINRYKKVIKKYQDKIKLVISDIIEIQKGVNKPTVIILHTIRDKNFSSNVIVYNFFKEHIIEYRFCKIKNKKGRKTFAMISENFCKKESLNTYYKIPFLHKINNYEYYDNNL